MEKMRVSEEASPPVSEPPPPPGLAQHPPLPPAAPNTPATPPALPFRRTGNEVGTVPPQPEPVSGVILEETSVEDKTKARLMLAMLAVILVIGVGVTSISLLSNFIKSGGNKKGMIHVVMYQQTTQRMNFMTMAANQHYMQHGEFPTRTEQLLAQGLDAGMQWDKFGTKFRIEGTRIRSAGEDQKHGTKDDFWIDMQTHTMGGAILDVERTLEDVEMLPPEMKTALKQARMAKEEAHARRSEMERMAQMADGYHEFSPDIDAESIRSGFQSSSNTGSSWSGGSSSYDPNLYSGRESDEDY